MASEQLDGAALTAADLAAYEADATSSVGEGNILSRITHMVRELKARREDVRIAEEALKAAQQAVQLIEEGTLPELMAEAGQERLRTIDGDDLAIKESVNASIPVARVAEAIEWLDRHNQGALVKRELKLMFGMGDRDEGDRVIKMLVGEGLVPSDKQFVHPQSLAAAVREMLALGVNVPLYLLGVHVRKRVEVKEPKRK